MFIIVRKGLLFFFFNEEENVIVEYLFEMVMRGMGFRLVDVMKLV